MPATWVLWLIISLVGFLAVAGLIVLGVIVWRRRKKDPLREAQRERLALEQDRAEEILTGVGRIPYTSDQEVKQAESLTSQIRQTLRNSRTVVRRLTGQWESLVEIRENEHQAQEAEANIRLLSRR